MVSFYCDACQDTVKLPKVDNHVKRCRDCWVLTCIDCSTAFEGEAFREHKTCISEAEKYQKSLYKGPKGADAKNKGEKKQEQWIALLSAVAAKEQDPKLRSMLNQICDQPNVPRKEKKFNNWASNSMRVRDPKILAKLWQRFAEALEGAKKGPSNGQQQQQQQQHRPDPEQPREGEKSKKEANQSDKKSSKISSSSSIELIAAVAVKILKKKGEAIRPSKLAPKVVKRIKKSGSEKVPKESDVEEALLVMAQNGSEGLALKGKRITVA
eukprot:Clim_evm4s39 gene=Clim_evmTU4s39